MLQRILIAPDKFKGSLPGPAICELIEKGLLSACPGLRITRLPLADGGDGLLDMVLQYRAAETRTAEVRDPLGRPVSARWLLSEQDGTAYIEMAAASGLDLLKPDEYDCMRASTYGTGQLIREAIGAGVREVILGIGGSATNDGGMGMAAALGYRFLDSRGEELSPGGENLSRIKTIGAPDQRIWEGIRFRVACDVKNPLCGPQGATRVYAPQKGATPAMVEVLESGMRHYAELVEAFTGREIAGLPGAGAAGGLGAGCMAFLEAVLVGGTELAIEYSHAERLAREADLIITGEGRLDHQTLQGKLVSGIAALGKKYDKPVVAICGSLELTPEELREAGITAAFSIVSKPMSLEEAIGEAPRLLYSLSCNIGSLLALRILP
ncbi:MAG: glycerate kinase [Puia sp.]|nr:glycerate kinase [Puia sp.]